MKENTINQFIKYTNNFDILNSNIKRKQEHSLRVMNLSKDIATSLDLNNEKVEISCIIGLLHDIARFRQYTEFKTFNDLLSFDHGDKGVEILKNNNYIRNFTIDNRYDNVIYTAIRNHNKYKIEDNLDSDTSMFCKIIRDADKIDIIYEAINYFFVSEENLIESSIISEEVLNQFKNKMTIKKNKTSEITNIDRLITIIALIFDLNYKISFKIINDNNYINLLIDRFNYKNIDTKKKMEQVREIANNYIISHL